ncbi:MULTISPECIES: helix-turn-helix transcriptional regulator [Pseudomonas syringae group]|nr:MULTISPECIES: helix-turn-helix transcriptional regulator [Pseudomonas syringae group]
MNANLRMTGKQPAYFLELGRLISSVGDAQFVSNMYQLIAASVPIDLLELSEWTIDESEASIISIQPLGREATERKLGTPTALPDNQMLLTRMLNLDDSLLIHLKYTINDASGSNTGSSVAYQCNLVSRKSNRRCVISLRREPPLRDFSLHELSFLKNFSETLLPLLERHAQATRNLFSTPTEEDSAMQGGQQLQKDFNEKLTLSEVRLSLREKEICLGLLAGSTVPEMAEKLHVKNSSIETYLKRAAAKLGVKGRHGLVKWMIGVSQSA